jgi:hypothetical protein
MQSHGILLADTRTHDGCWPLISNLVSLVRHVETSIKFCASAKDAHGQKNPQKILLCWMTSPRDMRQRAARLLLAKYNSAKGCVFCCTLISPEMLQVQLITLFQGFAARATSADLSHDSPRTTGLRRRFLDLVRDGRCGLEPGRQQP